MRGQQHKPAVVLLVEDDPGDRELTRRALQEDVFRVELRCVTDGEEALHYLRREGPYADPDSSPRPDLVLLDLNMPKMDGRELLQEIRSAPELRHLPVVILTTSDGEPDIIHSYKLNCQSFITKPVEPDSFIKAIRDLGSYWFQLVTLPPTRR